MLGRKSKLARRPTVLIRQWIEHRRDACGDDVAGRVERLEQAVFHKRT